MLLLESCILELVNPLGVSSNIKYNLHGLTYRDVGTKRLSDLSKPTSMLVARPGQEPSVLNPGLKLSVFCCSDLSVSILYADST